MKQIYLLILGLFLYSITAYGQTVDLEKDELWLDAGLGIYGYKENAAGLSLNLSLNLFSDSTLYKIRYMDHEEIQIMGYDDDHDLYSIAMMFGKGHSGKYTQALFSIGLGVIVESNRDDFDHYTGRYNTESKMIVLTLPLEINLLLKPISSFGFGITLWGDLNFNAPIYGLMLKFAIGKLR